MDAIPFFAIYTILRLVIPFALIIMLSLAADRYFTFQAHRPA